MTLALVLLLAAAPTPDAILGECLTFLAHADPDTAEKKAREGLAKHPAANGFHYVIGEALYQKKKPAEAFYELQWEALRAGPDRPTGDAATKRAASIAKEARGAEADEVRVVVTALESMRSDPKAAAEKLEQVIDDRGDRFVLRMLLAEARDAAGERASAMPIYRQLIAKDPHFVPAYVALAVALEKEGKKADAEKLIAKARAVDGDHWRLRAYDRP